MDTTKFKATRYKPSCILHMSDLHFGSQSIQGHFESLADFLFKKNVRPTHIVITGDIVNNLSENSFNLATKSLSDFYRRVKDSCTRLIIVPGNHDRRSVGLITFPRLNYRWDNFVHRLKNELWALNTSDRNYCRWNEETKNVYSTTDTFVYLGPKPQEFLPTKKMIHAGAIMDIEHRLLFFLFDSTGGGSFSRFISGLTEKCKYLFARGGLDENQITAAKTISNIYKKYLWKKLPQEERGMPPKHFEKLAMTVPYFLTIACMHHHLLPRPYKLSFFKEILINIREWFTATLDREKILDQLEKKIGCNLILTGHEHYIHFSLNGGMFIQQTGSVSKSRHFKEKSFSPNCLLIEISTADLRPDIRKLKCNGSWEFSELEREFTEDLCNWHANWEKTERQDVIDALHIADLRHKVIIDLNASDNADYVSATVEHQLRMNVTESMSISHIIDLVLPSKFWFPGGGHVKKFRCRNKSESWNDVPPSCIKYSLSKVCNKKISDTDKIIFEIKDLEDRCYDTVEIELCIQGEKLLCRNTKTYKKRYCDNSFEEDIRLELPVGAQVFELILKGFQKAYPSKVPKLRVHTWSAPLLDKEEEEKYEPLEFSELYKATRGLRESLITSDDEMTYKGVLLPPCSTVWINWSLK